MHLNSDGLDLSAPSRDNVGETTRERIVSGGLFPPLTRRHGIQLCGVSEARSGFYFVRKNPQMWQTLVCTGGAGEVWDAEQAVWRRIGAGFAYVTPPGVPHAYRLPAFEEYWLLAWVMLPAASISARAAAPAIVETDGEPLASSIRGLHAEALNRNGGDPTVTESWAALVRAYSARLCVAAATNRPEAAGDPRLIRLFAAVVADPAYAWDLGILAERAGISGEHLRRLCRTEGIGSPMHRVTELRMRHAAALLASGFYTVERAAARVGYGNPFAFSTAFKRILGRSPSSLRPGSG